jgi:hypothetical protein
VKVDSPVALQVQHMFNASTKLSWKCKEEKIPFKPKYSKNQTKATEWFQLKLGGQLRIATFSIF